MYVMYLASSILYLKLCKILRYIYEIVNELFYPMAQNKGLGSAISLRCFDPICSNHTHVISGPYSEIDIVG